MLSSDFLKHFSKLEDPRVTNHNSRHKFIDILVLAFVANLCGCDDWTEVVAFCKIKKQLFEQFLELPNGISSHDTFSRVFAVIDIVNFEEIFITWMNELFVKSKGEIVAIDGKTVRGSRTKEYSKGIHLVNAWACKNQLTLGVVRVDRKTNEITAIPKLLKLLNITNCTVTIDAMGCQRKIVKEIIDRGANYVLTVKGNQQDLKDDISDVFSNLENKENIECCDSGVMKESQHGRDETRRYISLPIITTLPLLKDTWEGIQSITKVIRTRTLNGKRSEEILYYISSHSYHS